VTAELSLENAWTNVREKIQKEVGKERYNLWVQNTRLIELAGSVARIGVPNLFVATWLEERLLGEFRSAITEVFGKRLSVQFVVDGTLYRRMKRRTVRQVREFERKASASVRSGLNEKFALDRLAVGKCNKIAYLSARKIVDSPSELNNSLFIYGPDSCGKTHLLQGLAMQLAEERPESRVVYTTGDKFSNQFVWALKNKKLSEFRSTFREADWLIVDDVDVLQTKKAAQDEFLHSIDFVLNCSRHVVTASNAHPNEMKLRRRLAGRLLSGMVADVRLPDFETRVEILGKLSTGLSKTTRKAFSLKIFKYLAEEFPGNTYDLVGAFVKLGAYVSLLPGKGDTTRLSVRGVERALSDLGKGQPKEIGLERICEQTAEFFGLEVSAVLSKSRRKSVSLPRQICMYLARRLTRHTLAEIGSYFGGRSHSAVSSSERRIAKLITVDRATGDSVARIEAALRTARS
jgi:chromosomal replication initiator protein